jgi:hypothetical protein
MKDETNKIAALEAKIEKLEASLAPTPNDEAAVGAWRDAQHKIAEARASVTGFGRADLAEFERACPTSTMRDIVRDNRAPSGPSSQGVIPSSQQMSNVRTGGGPRGTGWAREVPLSSPPGIAWVDALCEVDAAKERGVRMVEEAKRKAAENAK